jgi:hypothetical protein
MSWFRRGEPATTRYADEDFALALPGAWREDHEESHAGFVLDDESQQVTVAVLETSRVMDVEALTRVALDLAGKRQQALRDLGSATLSFGDMATQPAGEGVDVSFDASDPRGIQTRVVVCARPRRIVTLSFNKYAPLLSEDEFRRRADAIRSGFRVS